MPPVVGPTRASHTRRCTIASAAKHDPYLPTPQSWAYVDAWEDDSEALREARTRAAELGCVPVTRPVAALLSGMTSAGVLTSIDIEAENQRVARETFTALGYDHVHTRLIAGRALDVLPRLSDAAYDVVFVDGDKTEYPAILTQAKRLLRVGGLAIFDNVLWSGRVADPGEREAETVALRDVTGAVRQDDDWMPALLTVGDGLLVASLRNRS